MNETWTRRELLKQTGVAAAAAAGLGLVGCASDGHKHKHRNKSLQYFVSRPDLTPPKVKLTHVEPGHPLQYLFLGLANSGPGQGGAMIMDTSGELVWFSPDTVNNSKMDFQRQLYNGKPVLTWFQGKVITGGHGEGVGIVADPSYQTMATIHGHNGLKVDLHEFVVTPRGTALVTAYRTVNNYDLSPYGGPKHGVLWSGVAQEIDIATGKLIFEWDSLDHIPISESYLTKFDGTKKKPYDYFHINTIADAPDGSGDFLIGARNTWSVFKVSRKTGQIIWRLNGKLSDFTMAPGSEFYWQHDTRPHGPNILTVFDDGWDAVMPKDEIQSRALVLGIDYNAMLVTLQRQYVNKPKVLARAMGNTQLLPDGGVFVGWGTNPYFSEFSADGKLLLEGQLTKHDPTYRSFIGPWTGHPVQQELAVAARRRSGGAMVYASWNGATEVASWSVLAGNAKTALAPVGSARKSGFETAIAVRAKGPYFAVEARNAKGHVLSRSNPVKVT